jgi:hypothetical protein
MPGMPTTRHSQLLLPDTTPQNLRSTSGDSFSWLRGVLWYFLSTMGWRHWLFKGCTAPTCLVGVLTELANRRTSRERDNIMTHQIGAIHCVTRWSFM